MRWIILALLRSVLAGLFAYLMLVSASSGSIFLSISFGIAAVLFLVLSGNNPKFIYRKISLYCVTAAIGITTFGMSGLIRAEWGELNANWWTKIAFEIGENTIWIAPVLLIFGFAFGCLEKSLNSASMSGTIEDSAPNTGVKKSYSPPNEWQTILPNKTKYETANETKDYIDIRSQTRVLEYGPHGHAHSLQLRGSEVRLEISFTCKITNPYKAAFEADEFAMNVLPLRFLLEARGIIETHSYSALRSNRKKVSGQILKVTAPIFESHGINLETVTLGAIHKLSKGNNGF